MATHKTLILIVLIVWVACVAACSAQEQQTAGISVNGNIVTVKPPARPKALGWLVTIEKKTEDSVESVVRDVFRAPRPFQAHLPEGSYAVKLTGLLPIRKKEGKAGVLSLDTVEVTVEATEVKSAALKESPLGRMDVADLPEHTGRLVLVRGCHVIELSVNPGPIRVSVWVNRSARTGTRMYIPPIYFADHTAGAYEPINLSGEGLPPMFVQFEALALFGPIRSRIGEAGPVYSRKALYIFRIKPLGLVRPHPKVAEMIQKDWDGKSPLPENKDRSLSRSYMKSVRYLESKGIPVKR
jgi:hypothetical protein